MCGVGKHGGSTAKEFVCTRGKQLPVVVPAYNEGETDRRSAEDHTRPADLIIVVDDASTDQTLDVAASYRRQLGDRLALLSHKENQG